MAWRRSPGLPGQGSAHACCRTPRESWFPGADPSSNALHGFEGRPQPTGDAVEPRFQRADFDSNDVGDLSRGQVENEVKVEELAIAVRQAAAGGAPNEGR